MAAPAVPTLITLVAEGLKKAGYASPTTAQQDRGEDKYIEEIKNDIWTMANKAGTKLRPLQTKAYDVTVIGQDTYPTPSDYASDMTVVLLAGTITGTARAGAVGSITLAADDTSTEDYMLGKYILITENTGVDGCTQCVGFNTTTKEALVEPDYGTAPDNTSTYLVIDHNYPLLPAPAWDLDNQPFPMTKERPKQFVPTGNSTDGELQLFPTSDKVYGLQFRYYADLMVLDLAGTLMGTLYQRWRNIWIQGVFAKELQNDAVTTDDNRANSALSTYYALIESMIEREGYAKDIDDLTITVNG